MDIGENEEEISTMLLRHIFGKSISASKTRVLAIAGSTCTGKTTLAEALQHKKRVLLFELVESGLSVGIIKQDHFYKRQEEVETLWNADNPSIIFYNYDQVQSLDEREMLQEASTHISRGIDTLLIEGNMITDLHSVANMVDYALFFTIGKELCRSRRVFREYDPPDEEGYFDQVVWPAYEGTLSRAKMRNECNGNIRFLESRDQKTSLDDVIIEFQHLICDKLVLGMDVLDSDSAIGWVSSPGCGAISVFIGTTRDTNDGKGVEKLEYECYESMAYAELRRLCKTVRENHPSVLRIYIGHRLGVVPIGEASVIIATSSPHRRAAMAATEWLIDELKKHVQIWKKEIYEDGTHSWRENAR